MGKTGIVGLAFVLAAALAWAICQRWLSPPEITLRAPLSSRLQRWLPLQARSEAFAAACARRGFTVRAFPGEGVRVTIAEPAANDLFLATALSRERWSM